MKEAKIKGACTVWFHLDEISRKGKFMEPENKSENVAMHCSGVLLEIG
jgi:hypothetical protein